MVKQTFDDLLEESVRIHGHLCAGQVLGVRMALLGLRRIAIRDPKGADRKALIVFVEMDRCASDAIQSVTGCSLGKRSLKFLDYGKMAATFLNLRTGTAVRVLAREDARQRAKELHPEAADIYAGQREAYKVMSDEELFVVRQVSVTVAPEDRPGRPLRRVSCEACGEHVQDMREVVADGRTLCIPCAQGGYYRERPSFMCEERYAKQT
jgi:formylmethanofuran dehydrogenase subunit E